MGALISSAIANLINFFAKHFLATKVVLATLIITILPIVLWNLIYDLMSVMFSIVQSVLPQNMNLSLQPLSFACWFLHTFKIVEALSVVISASITRFAISLIPFVGAK
ncbi:MAG: hypothetical protein JHC31_14725 [Sulfurihydrogenibium sp.]|jgi:hypothetical protein|nr:hypothetical protein [Sulfurihydrogenibium sp.]MBX0312994.1 hypothetical protein [Sulfurihydrogenibium sp.]